MSVVTIQKGIATAVAYTVVPGTLTFNREANSVGGSVTEPVKAGYIRSGSFQCVLTDANEDAILALPAGAGFGDYTIGASGDLLPADNYAFLAIVEIVIAGNDGLDIATISYSGTIDTPA